MGMTKKDISRRKANFKAKLDELEERAKNDPMKRDRKLHEEIAEIKKQLAQLE